MFCKYRQKLNQDPIILFINYGIFVVESLRQTKVISRFKTELCMDYHLLQIIIISMLQFAVVSAGHTTFATLNVMLEVFRYEARQMHNKSVAQKANDIIMTPYYR